MYGELFEACFKFVGCLSLIFVLVLMVAVFAIAFSIGRHF